MEKQVQYLEEAVIRFAGDSGDGMQLVGTLFSNTSGSIGNDVNTFPDYPSEIRAPEGTLYGVSAYQIQFGQKRINTPGNKIDLLVAMNASSLKVNLPHVKKGALIIVNSAGFDEKNLRLAKYQKNPLEDNSLSDYQVVPLNISGLVKEELKDSQISPKYVDRTKNIFALGMTYWLYDRPLHHTEKWLEGKFGKKADILASNKRVLKAGWEFANTSEIFKTQFKIKHSDMKPGYYRNITGNHAVAIGLVIAAHKANMPLFLGSYPITPATEILHFISGYKEYKVKHLQAEDEIAGVCSAIGASYGGFFAATTTSGPGLSLKVEAIGLAVILELPLVIVDVQRGGPSTGLPTKPEQSDLFMAMYGRHGEAPLPIVAATSASDCFDMTIEAGRLAIKYMTPVILLTDGYLAQGTNPWKIPNLDELPDIHPTFVTNPEGFAPYKRDPQTLARLWAIPGTQGLEHRIGGLEKEDITGLVTQDPANHQKMVDIRAKKIENIVNDIPLAVVEGEQHGDLLILGWGGTYGAIKDAFDKLRSDGKKVSYCHLKHLNPFPKNLEQILKSFKRILIPELNMGHLRTIIRSTYLIDSIGLNKVQGLPLNAYEVEDKVNELLKVKE
ncbi:MAG: 2-oxoglutarate ferredoxin oxidoreductase subunit alpha [Ignavibacteria bacterium GWB2_35_12]|nr:MAG: 2-oxoglutarate ferredoxin oxidoreductase subunit alpha [Ignavibacteria bacterium GWA2_35_8]OGU40069.1 MAG: 2-oxoglutarate ferredoxin oxidoreductase subunit alpha [Ignavibacteria bacterium GWB2_35_12]OGU94013.1 MAG: 2-oxoglutarate ferredoxin oxidoreductase subunit alpha [Ignavibacteria bacterium RIFOXYA2_FULL_35_10]OGV22870.1 MAG: 2-oxoglutarate ferredoxin oxidoreductase subunit alpha [Ignavibacteria bacterium RIFOXYC2_FULL_35_21]